MLFRSEFTTAFDRKGAITDDTQMTLFTAEGLLRAYVAGAARGDLIALISQLTDQMHTAAAELQFEVAARIRDEIRELKQELRGMQAAGV